jgi:hypothetical protein
MWWQKSNHECFQTAKEKNNPCQAPTPWKMLCSFHFTDEEIESQKGGAI